MACFFAIPGAPKRHSPRQPSFPRQPSLRRKPESIQCAQIPACAGMTDLCSNHLKRNAARDTAASLGLRSAAKFGPARRSSAAVLVIAVGLVVLFQYLPDFLRSFTAQFVHDFLAALLAALLAGFVDELLADLLVVSAQSHAV